MVKARSPSGEEYQDSKSIQERAPRPDEMTLVLFGSDVEQSEDGRTFRYCVPKEEMLEAVESPIGKTSNAITS
jgi:hypothetical protein